MEACNVGSLDEDEAYLLVHAFSEFAVGRGGQPVGTTRLDDVDVTSKSIPLLPPYQQPYNMGGSPLAIS